MGVQFLCCEKEVSIIGVRFVTCERVSMTMNYDGLMETSSKL